MPQDTMGFVWLAVGLILGSLATWALMRRRFDDFALERRQGDEMRNLEQQLHLKECECIDRLAEQKRELLAAREADLRDAIAETRAVERAEFERQVKSFSVKVSPYVSVSKTGGRWKRVVQSESGYQYQLLVNGVPAFAPHLEITNRDSDVAVDEESLLKLASQATEVAVQAAGAASQFVQLAAPIVKKQLGSK